MNATTAEMLSRNAATVEWLVRRAPGETKPDRIELVGELLGLACGRAESYWYRKVRRTTEEEYQQIQDRKYEARSALIQAYTKKIADLENEDF